MSAHEMQLVDEIRRRLDATYEEALAGLEEGEGELLKALAAIERRRKAQAQQTQSRASEIIDRVMALTGNGAVRAVRVKLGPRLVKEIPVALGRPGAIAVALVSLLFSECNLELIRGEEAPGATGG